MALFSRPFLGLTLLATLGLCMQGLTAQKTWIVDYTGKGDHKTIQAAVDAAKDGDQILIRAGSYKATMVTSKALTMRGLGKPRIAGLLVRSLASSQQFTLRDIECGRLLLSSNLGTVHCENATAMSYSLIYIIDCAFVSLLDCPASLPKRYQQIPNPPITIVRSSVAVTRCDCRGENGIALYKSYGRAAPALHVTDSHVRISGGSFQGGSGSPYYPNRFGNGAPGIELRGVCDITIDDAGGTSVTAGSPSSSNLSMTAITARSAKSTLTIDPKVKLISQGTANKVSGVKPNIKTLTGLLAKGALLGGKVQTSRHGQAGSASILLLGAPGSRLPTSFGEVWFQLGGFLALDPAVLPTNGIRQLPIAVPNQGIPHGLALCLQGLEWTGKELLLSPPTVVLVN